MAGIPTLATYCNAINAITLNSATPLNTDLKKLTDTLLSIKKSLMTTPKASKCHTAITSVAVLALETVACDLRDHTVTDSTAHLREGIAHLVTCSPSKYGASLTDIASLCIIYDSLKERSVKPELQKFDSDVFALLIGSAERHLHSEEGPKHLARLMMYIIETSQDRDAINCSYTGIFDKILNRLTHPWVSYLTYDILVSVLDDLKASHVGIDSVTFLPQVSWQLANRTNTSLPIVREDVNKMWNEVNLMAKEVMNKFTSV